MEPRATTNDRLELVLFALLVAFLGVAPAQGLETYTPPLRSKNGNVLACSVQNLGSTTVSIHARLVDQGAEVVAADAEAEAGETVEIVSTAVDVLSGYCHFSGDIDLQKVRGVIQLRSADGANSLHVFPAFLGTGVDLAEVVTVSPPVRNLGGDQVICMAQNLSDSVINVTSELIDEDAHTISSVTKGVAPGEVRALSKTADHPMFYCRFTFSGSANALRTYITTHTPLAGDTHLLYAASAPAQLYRSTAYTPPLSSPEGYGTVCLVQNLDAMPVDVTVSLFDDSGAVLDSDTITAASGSVYTVAGHTELSTHVLCKFDFEASSTTARGYIMQYAPPLFSDTRLVAAGFAGAPTQHEPTTTVTAPLRSAGDTVACLAVNVSESDVDVDVEIEDGSGTVVAHTLVETVPYRATVGVTTVQDIEDGFCRFTFQSSAQGIRGFAAVLGSGGTLTKLLLPALETGRVTRTATATATRTATQPATATITATLTQPATATRTLTATLPATATRTATASPTATSTSTNSPTFAPTATPTATVSSTSVATATRTATASSTLAATATATPTMSSTSAATATATATASSTLAATATATATQTAAMECVGDCDGSGEVSIDEIVVMANIAAGLRAVDDCPAGDRNGDGLVTVDEILRAVANALAGC